MTPPRQMGSGGLPKRKVTSEAMLRRLAGSLHHHSCKGCSLRYGCACKEPQLNRHCQECRPVRPGPRPTWDRSTDPAECCLDNCIQLVDTDELARYSLAGPGPWFQCKTCKRAHGRLPRSRT